MNTIILELQYILSQQQLYQLQLYCHNEKECILTLLKFDDY
jgi:hypothetical protein